MSMLGTVGLARRQAVTAFALIFTALLVYVFVGTSDRRRHQLAQTDEGAPGAASKLSTTNQVSDLCSRHGFRPFTRQGGNSYRRVYDLFLLSHELDWLEIRLNTLAPYVDYFVIVESPWTFTGLQKPLHLQENWANFTSFHHKIIHQVVDDSGLNLGSRTWDHEDYFRNSLFHSTFPDLLYSEREAQRGDVLIVSDVDEIPKPEALNVLRYCDFPERLTLRSDFYYYSFQWMHVGEQWPHPQATVFRGLHNTISPVHLRNGEGGPTSWIPFLSAMRRWWQKTDMWEAAWHCSSCFASMEEMRAKMAGFSHTPWNTAENRDEGTMMHRVRNGLDLFGRTGEDYRRVENNLDVPPYILQHKDEFKYLLDRDGEDAGFRDYQRSIG
ncbi:glycosyltransferase family 17 [Lecanosticta acicola]|uniref:Glycosyltransferase family 17 n=1 Tax=Lecanosticta acicola TaxID=111012 RepID=A0AAI9EA09_9PEZI|nr:glycosyltransferase family 17 [Lecanosticta acicola]